MKNLQGKRGVKVIPKRDRIKAIEWLLEGYENFIVNYTNNPIFSYHSGICSNLHYWLVFNNYIGFMNYYKIVTGIRCYPALTNLIPELVPIINTDRYKIEYCYWYRTSYERIQALRDALELLTKN